MASESTEPAVKVTFTVAVEMTQAQRDKYSRGFGVEGVGLEVANRVRPAIDEAIHSSEGWLRWMSGNATFVISEPKAEGGGVDR